MTDFNASNRKDIRKAEKASALQSLQDAEAVTAIMTTIPGRAWMWRQLGTAHIFVSDFTGDPMRDAFSAGERNFGLRLLADIMRHCPESYLQMTREANDRHHSNDRSTAPERRSGEEPDGGDTGSSEAGDVASDYDPYRDSPNGGFDPNYH